MHKWTWSLAAVALLGLASGCEEQPTNERGVAPVESGNEGDETPRDSQSLTEGRPDITGGENPADQEFYGRVTGMDADSLTVRHDNGTTMTFSLDEDTRILRQGRSADRALLREGQPVRTAYDERGGQYEATTVELLPRPATLPGE